MALEKVCFSENEINLTSSFKINTATDGGKSSAIFACSVGTHE